MTAERHGSDVVVVAPSGRTRPLRWPLARSLASGEEIVEEEFLRLEPDGPPTRFRCNSSPILDADERMYGGWKEEVIGRDMTEVGE